MTTPGAAGRFFITPSAVRDWQEQIAPGSSYNEAMADIIDWAQDARKMDVAMGPGLAKYRARKPLQCYFVTDENPHYSGGLPAIIAVLKPHARWVPGKPARDYAALPKSEGRPEVRARVPESVRAWVEAQGAGWLCKHLCELARSGSA